jgi:hypothetical protein
MELSSVAGDASQSSKKTASSAVDKSKDATGPGLDSKQQAAPVKKPETATALENGERQIPPADRTNGQALSGAI